MTPQIESPAMTFFGRMQVQKADPYHDAQGQFTSASGAVAPHGKGLPNGKHHGDNAYATLMNTLQKIIPPNAFKNNYPIISQAVNESLKNHKNWSSASKAQEIWADLKNSKIYGVTSAMVPGISTTQGNPIFKQMTDALTTTEGSGASSVHWPTAPVIHEAPVGAMVPGMGIKQAPAPAVESDPKFQEAYGKVEAWAKTMYKGGLTPADKAAALGAVKDAMKTAWFAPGYNDHKASAVFDAAKATGKFLISDTGKASNSKLWMAVHSSVASYIPKPAGAAVQSTAPALTPKPAAVTPPPAPSPPPAAKPTGPTPVAASVDPSKLTHKPEGLQAVYGVLANMKDNGKALYDANKDAVDKAVADAWNANPTSNTKAKADAIYAALQQSPLGSKINGSTTSSMLYSSGLLPAIKGSETGVKATFTGPVKAANPIQATALGQHVQQLVGASNLALSVKEHAQLVDAVKQTFAEAQPGDNHFGVDIANKMKGELAPSELATIKGLNWDPAFHQVKMNPNDPTMAGPSIKIGDHDLTGYKNYEGDHMGFAGVMKQRALTGLERKALVDYKDGDYIPMNGVLRLGHTGSASTLSQIDQLTNACNAGTVPKGTVLWRGVPSYAECGIKDPVEFAKQGGVMEDSGFCSTATVKSFADTWQNHGPKATTFEFKFTKDVNAVHVAKGRGSSGDGEYEIILQRNTKWKCVGYRQDVVHGKRKHTLVMEAI